MTGDGTGNPGAPGPPSTLGTPGTSSTLGTPGTSSTPDTLGSPGTSSTLCTLGTPGARPCSAARALPGRAGRQGGGDVQGVPRGRVGLGESDGGGGRVGPVALLYQLSAPDHGPQPLPGDPNGRPLSGRPDIHVRSVAPV
ncbi:MAG TPA: hypothetical protein VH478_12720 [Trebonia sp.]|nr:hypothetical protein [Trebonia sp.]